MIAPTPEQMKVLLALADVITDVVRAAGPEGVPGGHLYAHLMKYLTLGQFESLMSALVGAGRVKKAGQVYIAVSLEPTEIV